MEDAWQKFARGARVCLCLVPLSGCFYDTKPGAADSSTAPGTSTTESSTSTDPAPTTASLDDTTLATISTSSSSSTSSGTGTTADDTTGACREQPWYFDDDGDGFGVEDMVVMACEAPPGHVAVAGDCAPKDNTVSPGQLEQCDAKDNDCDLGVDEYSPTNLTCNNCRAVLWDTRVFYLCTVLTTWAAARTACQVYGGGADFAVIHSQAEHDALVAGIAEVPADAMTSWWLGLTDALVEASFGWIDTTMLDFTAWRSLEPNDSMGNEDCVELTPTAEWNDANCALVRHYICEGPQ